MMPYFFSTLTLLWSFCSEYFLSHASFVGIFGLGGLWGIYKKGYIVSVGGINMLNFFMPLTEMSQDLVVLEQHLNGIPNFFLIIFFSHILSQG